MAYHTESLALTNTTLDHLAARVREEAVAAVNARSIEATLAHVALATAYAKRFGEASAIAETPGEKWVNENRIW